MSRSRYTLAAILYVLAMTYASTIIGPNGPNFVAFDHHEAMSRLIHMRFVEHGSDQRSDWMGNLVMLVPLGFLLTGSLAPRRRMAARFMTGVPSNAGHGTGGAHRHRDRPGGRAKSGPLAPLPRHPPDEPGDDVGRQPGDDVGRQPAVGVGNRGSFALTAIGAFVLCFAVILTVKYAQLFFPPRTVTLNYVLAQSLGAAIGIVLFGILRTPLAEAGRDLGRLESLRVILRVYSGLVILFLLMPLDFALSAADLSTQLDKLPASFTAISGEGRPPVVRLMVQLAGSLAMMPIGALLTLMARGRVYVGRSVGGATWIGFCVMLSVYAATALLISGAPSLPAVGFRTIGIALGAWLMHWLTRQNPAQIRYGLGRLVPWAVPFYLLAVAAVNGLLSREWITPAEAANDFYHLGLLPLFNYYIVTKAQAAKNMVAHAIMYAPIGVMIWLRVRDGGGKGAAFVLAALLSAIVETGRFLRPGLVPDINAIPLAGIAAWAAVALMPVLWRVLSAVAIGLAAPLPLSPGKITPGDAGWRDRANAPRVRPVQIQAIGDVEEY